LFLCLIALSSASATVSQHCMSFLLVTHLSFLFPPHLLFHVWSFNVLLSPTCWQPLYACGRDVTRYLSCPVLFSPQNRLLNLFPRRFHVVFFVFSILVLFKPVLKSHPPPKHRISCPIAKVEIHPRNKFDESHPLQRLASLPDTFPWRADLISSGFIERRRVLRRNPSLSYVVTDNPPKTKASPWLCLRIGFDLSHFRID